MLWLTTGSGLYGLDPQTMRITKHFVHDPQNPTSIQSNGVLTSVEDTLTRYSFYDSTSGKAIQTDVHTVVARPVRVCML